MRSIWWVCLLAVTSARAAVVTNGDFGPDNQTKGWQAGHAAYRFADDDGFGAPGCVIFTGPAPATVEGPRQEFAVKPHTEYVLSAAVKGDGRTSPCLRLQRADGNGVAWATAGKVNVWTSVLVRFNSGPNPRLTLVCVGNDQDSAEGAKAWFDDVAVLLPEEVPAGHQVQGGFVKSLPGENIARECKVTFSSSPNYGYSLDEGDAVQLTDGEYSPGYFWVQKSTVGWSGISPLIVTLDLGKVQPITGLSYNTAAGCAGVAWPSAIMVLVSDDGQTFKLAGDLVTLAAKNGLPAAERYSVYRYVTGDLRTRGRFVQLAVVSPSGFTFCDEIEVYRGSDSLMEQEPSGPVVTDVKELVRGSATKSGIFWRLVTDLGEARAAVESAKLPDAQKERLKTRLDAADREIPNLPDPDIENFKAILPLNETHARILSVYGAVLRSRGLPAFFAWKKNRYDRVQPTEAPDAAPRSVSLSVEMMGNEFRSESFLLTNTTDKSVNAALRVQGMPGAPRPKWLNVSAVPWTDTSNHAPVAAALPDAEFVNGTYRIPVPAGMTRRIWLSVDSSSLKAGTFSGNLLVEATGQNFRIPLTIRVSPIRMGRPRLSLGMWDYTDGSGGYGINANNLMSAISMMRSHFVDSPWAGSGALPWPEAGDFDGNHQLKKPMDFAHFDEWVKRWPDARRYLVFANVLDRAYFAGARMSTPEFNARVGSWAKALKEHMISLGLKPQQLGILLVDEPWNDASDEYIVGWARPIKVAAPEITLFEDTAWERPDLTKIQDAITIADIICPCLQRVYTGGSAAQSYFAQRRAAGQQLWTYMASGPAKLFDPYRYHRLQAWHCFRFGMVGMGYWAFGDSAGSHTSWNEYTATGTPYTPVFLGKDDVTDGIHWQAVREGIEDYEYLSMLRDAASKCGDAALKQQAEKLLTEAVDKVLGPRYDMDVSWRGDIDRSVADVYRLQILALLEKMAQ